MFFAICFWGLLTLPPVRAFSWDDFSNNLATDLAPFLSLFGEQITKQYLSESITWLDYFIFAMAPMGVLTAIVSAIRVCGSPTLRAFIGRAQEGGGLAEAELCSSTSRDVCELYNNGGIARVFGRPKILEVVYDPNEPDFNGTAGIYRFREYLRSQNGEAEWEDKQKHRRDTEKNVEPETYAPNLSLNVGIKRQPQSVFWTVAIAGLILQAGVLVYAGVVTYYLKWKMDGSLPDSYACPMVIVGTILLCLGNFLCAFMVGQSTKEQVFRRKPPAGKKAASSIYWVQPGGQVLGDQAFDPFCCSDHDKHVDEYIISSKNRSENWIKNSELAVWAAVGITIAGFILQFIGLRGIHSTVSVAQLGVIMVMSAARAGLRTQRLKTEDNFLRHCPDEVVGHELDWLAVRIGGEGIQHGSNSSSPASLSRMMSSPPDNSRRYLWRFRGTPGDSDRIRHELPPTPDHLNVAGKFLAYRTRLAQLTQSTNTNRRTATSAADFEVDMVEVRENALRLAQAIESAATTIFSKSPKIREEWNDAESIFCGFACDVVSKDPRTSSELSKHSTELINPYTLYLHLRRDSPDSPWRLQNTLDLEGILGLWVWSLKSDPAVEGLDSHSQLTVSRAAEIQPRRIISTNRNITESDLKMWLSGTIPSLVEATVQLTSIQQSNPSTIWQHGKEKTNRYDLLSNRIPEELSPQITRFFGWHATELSPSQHSGPFRVWSTATNSSFLSLCTQEVFGSFIKSILGVVDDFGNIEIQQEMQHLRLENSLVSELAKVFTESQLGSRDDALLCVSPPIISRLTLSSTGSALATARKSANLFRRRYEWNQADALLRWAWRVYSGPRSSHTSKDLSIEAEKSTERAAIALGELYRWAMRGNDTKNFGLDGIKWLSGQKSGSSQPLPVAVDEIIDRYSDIAKRVVTHANNVSGGGLLSAIGVGLTETLVYLTLPNSIETEEKGKALCLAAKHGWAEVVHALLELGAGPDFEDPEEGSRTALSHAAQSGSIDTVKELMDGGALPTSADKKLWTPLSYASDMGHNFVVETLLGDQRVKPDTKDQKGWTPLGRAVAKGHEAVVKLLIEKGADVGAKQEDGETPLSQAAKNGHMAIVKLLIEKGADIEAADEFGGTPLLEAAGNGHEAILKLLIAKGADFEVKGGLYCTSLSEAAANGHEAIVRLLMEKGADIEVRALRSTRGTPLSQAAENGHEAIVRLLIEKGADIEAKGGYGRTPLSLAAVNGHEATVKLLIEKGADVEMEDDNGGTSLFRAVENKHEAIVKLLLEKGVNVEAKDNFGTTPLIRAARDGQEAIVKLLLEKGVEVGVKDPYNWTALSSAIEYGHEATVKLLIEKGADVERKGNIGRTPLSQAVANKHEAIVKLLLEKGVNVEAQDNFGQTPLVRAAQDGKEAIVKLLLGKGAEVGVKDRYGMTALSSAVEYGHEAIVKLLQ